MKQKEIIKAYQAIDRFNKNEKNRSNASAKLNYALFKIRKLLEPQFQFQQESEQKIFQDMSPTPVGEGKFNFGTPERMQEFFAKMKEIEEVEVDLEFTKPVVDLEEAIVIPMDDIEALEPFVEFKE